MTELGDGDFIAISSSTSVLFSTLYNEESPSPSTVSI